MRLDLIISRNKQRIKIRRNKDKNTFIRAVASTIVREKKVELTHSDYTKVAQDDVRIARGN